MKKMHIAVKVTIDAAKVITALTGFVVALAYLIGHL